MQNCEPKEISNPVTQQVDVPCDPPSTEWIIAQWPDGTLCDWSERHSYTWRSDDYEKLLVLSYDEEGVPVRTKPYKSSDEAAATLVEHIEIEP
jgi:hypothetical protein